MTAKTKEEPKPPQPGDVVERGTLPDGRPFHDVYVDEGKVYRLTRILVPESDAAWDASQNEDGTFNARFNGRHQLASAIVQPEGITVDSFDTLTAFDLEVLFRGFNRLNTLPPADTSGKRLTASAAKKLRKADKTVRGYISPSEINRLGLAKWWGKVPADFTGSTLYDLQAMSEFRDRVIEAEKDALERAKYGLKVDDNAQRYKGRRGPQKGDAIVKGGKSDDSW